MSDIKLPRQLLGRFLAAAGQGHNLEFGQQLEDRYLSVASPVSDTDDSGPNFAIRFHTMILTRSIAEFVGVLFCEIGQCPRLAADDRGKVIEDFVGLHRSAIGQLGVGSSDTVSSVERRRR